MLLRRLCGEPMTGAQLRRQLPAQFYRTSTGGPVSALQHFMQCSIAGWIIAAAPHPRQFVCDCAILSNDIGL
jgi:hypothetical protein